MSNSTEVLIQIIGDVINVLNDARKRLWQTNVEESEVNGKDNPFAGLSTRAQNALRREGIKTLSHLEARYNQGMIMTIRGISNGTASEIGEFLKKKGETGYGNKSWSDADGLSDL